MTTPDGQPATGTARQQTRSEPPDTIIEAAAQLGTDPCDVCCDAMPAYVIGDLTDPEQSWVVDHADDCNYCANMLHGYERVGTMLDHLQPRLGPTTPAPPPFRAAGRRASYGRMESPVGPLLVAVTEEGVCEISYTVKGSEAAFRDRLRRRGLDPHHDPEAIEEAACQLREYFAGRRDRFNVAVDLSGVTPFTRSVLTATAEVPFGHLTTYGDIAARIGQPRASRAVGNALGRNPVPVIVPCHRIVRSNATLGGYTGSVRVKEQLLSLEGAQLGQAR